MKNRVWVLFLGCLLAAVVGAGEGRNHDSVGDVEEANLILTRPDQGVQLSAFSYRVYIDGSYFGKLKNGARYALKLPVGEHRITANDHAKSGIRVHIGVDSVVYLQGLSQLQPRHHMQWKLLADDD